MGRGCNPRANMVSEDNPLVNHLNKQGSAIDPQVLYSSSVAGESSRLIPREERSASPATSWTGMYHVHYDANERVPVFEELDRRDAQEARRNTELGELVCHQHCDAHHNASAKSVERIPNRYREIKSKDVGNVESSGQKTISKIQTNRSAYILQENFSDGIRSNHKSQPTWAEEEYPLQGQTPQHSIIKKTGATIPQKAIKDASKVLSVSFTKDVISSATRSNLAFEKKNVCEMHDPSHPKFDPHHKCGRLKTIDRGSEECPFLETPALSGDVTPNMATPDRAERKELTRAKSQEEVLEEALVSIKYALESSGHVKEIESLKLIASANPKLTKILSERGFLSRVAYNENQKEIIKRDVAKISRMVNPIIPSIDEMVNQNVNTVIDGLNQNLQSINHKVNYLLDHMPKDLPPAGMPSGQSLHQRSFLQEDKLTITDPGTFRAKSTNVVTRKESTKTVNRAADESIPAGLPSGGIKRQESFALGKSDLFTTRQTSRKLVNRDHEAQPVLLQQEMRPVKTEQSFHIEGVNPEDRWRSPIHHNRYFLEQQRMARNKAKQLKGRSGEWKKPVENSDKMKKSAQKNNDSMSSNYIMWSNPQKLKMAKKQEDNTSAELVKIFNKNETHNHNANYKTEVATNHLKQRPAAANSKRFLSKTSNILGMLDEPTGSIVSDAINRAEAKKVLEYNSGPLQTKQGALTMASNNRTNQMTTYQQSFLKPMRNSDMIQPRRTNELNSRSQIVGTAGNAEIRPTVPSPKIVAKDVLDKIKLEEAAKAKEKKSLKPIGFRTESEPSNTSTPVQPKPKMTDLKEPSSTNKLPPKNALDIYIRDKVNSSTFPSPAPPKPEKDVVVVSTELGQQQVLSNFTSPLCSPIRGVEPYKGLQERRDEAIKRRSRSREDIKKDLVPLQNNQTNSKPDDLGDRIMDFKNFLSANARATVGGIN
jgi:hypothetical protein